MYKEGCSLIDNSEVAGRIIYALVLSTDAINPWMLNETVRASLSLAKDEAESYKEDIERDSEVVGRIFYAIKKISPNVRYDNTIRSIIEGALTISPGQACAYTRTLDNYVNLQQYIILQHLNFIEREAL